MYSKCTQAQGIEPSTPVLLGCPDRAATSVPIFFPFNKVCHFPGRHRLPLVFSKVDAANGISSFMT